MDMLPLLEATVVVTVATLALLEETVVVTVAVLPEAEPEPEPKAATSRVNPK